MTAPVRETSRPNGWLASLYDRSAGPETEQCPEYNMTQSDTGPPEDIPEEITTALEASSDARLREIIHYAQQLLQEHPPLTDAIESRAGEELVRTEDHGAYTIVVVERPEETGEAQGPFAYRVGWEHGLGDEDGQYRWHYLGKVYRGDGGN